MNKITSMKITGITLENFRNHTEPESFDFGDTTFITGHNGTGKTTMAHAVCYAFYGVSFYGEQKLERLQNSNANNVKVQLEFVDQNGETHILTRSRVGDNISLMYDGYSIQQTMVAQLFGDKNSFIAMFNPTYLTENLSKDGRELIMQHLKPVSKDDVTNALPQFKEILSGIDLDTQAPEKVLEDTRAGIRRTEEQLLILEGNIEASKQSKAGAQQKLDGLQRERSEIETQIAALKHRQFEDINLDDISIQKDILSRRLKECSGEDPQITELRNKLAEASARVYVSKFTDEITKARLEYKNGFNKSKELSERIANLKIGDVCPTCGFAITADNVDTYKAQLTEELTKIIELTNGIAARGKELTELDNKARTTFEQYKSDDIAKLTAEIEALKSASEQSDLGEIATQIEKLDLLEKNGNLTDEELVELNDLKASLVGINAQIEALEDSISDEKIKSGLEQKYVFEQEIVKYKENVDALKEYIFKRAELAAKELQMPNVTIKLFEVVRTTGEVKSTFKFEYKGREYSTLSLSEKMLAGIEISAMMRSITGKDYPICIDNTESIAAFNAVPMPSQVIMLRVAKDQPLTVKFQNRATSVTQAKAA